MDVYWQTLELLTLAFKYIFVIVVICLLPVAIGVFPSATHDVVKLFLYHLSFILLHFGDYVNIKSGGI